MHFVSSAKTNRKISAQESEFAHRVDSFASIFYPCNQYFLPSRNILIASNSPLTCLPLQCMGWSWYLANDMQFYVISPLILFTAYR